MKNNRLGKGLEALIPQMAEDETPERRESLFEVEISQIRVNPLQPRMEFDKERLEELKASIAENGVIQPVTVRKTSTGYELIAGERRFRAVSELGFKKIPAYVMAVRSDEHLLELALIENIQREDLNPVEVALAYQQLQKEYSLTQEEVAKKVGKDRATVANFIRLLKLPDSIQNSVRIGEIGMGHAKALMGLSELADQLALWKRCVAEGWNVRRVEEAVRHRGEKPAKSTPAPVKKSAYVREIEDRLRQRLGTQVKVAAGKNGGRIEISYYSNDDLDRIMELFDQLPA